jgi:hypothetical protein
MLKKVCENRRLFISGECVAGRCSWKVWLVGVAGRCGWKVWLVGVAGRCGWKVWLESG